VEFVGVNKADAVAEGVNLTARCSFPVLQDVDTVGAWDLHGGHKDDFLIYRADGTLADYLPTGGERGTNLSTPEGYANVKNAILTVLDE
jgi:hypothetical protein